MNLSPAIKCLICVAAAFICSYIFFDAIVGRKNPLKIGTTLQQSIELLGERAEHEKWPGEEKMEKNESKEYAETELVLLDSPYVVTGRMPKRKPQTEKIFSIAFDSIWTPQEEGLPLCPEKPPGLKGKIELDMRSPPLEEIEEEYAEMKPGGRWQPGNCTARNRVAFIIPFRDREEHLRGFLHNAHRFFQRQQLDYAIFVVEQAGHSLTFNKGRLMNAGVLEAFKLYPWQCVVFHDVDTLPANEQNMYTCPTDEKQAKHLGVGLADLGNNLMYEAFLGGATILTGDQFRRANGYSNDFWGWGGEDDDFYTRVNSAGMKFWRPSAEIGHYERFQHQRDSGNKPNRCRFEMLKHTKEKQSRDGLSSVRYRLKSMTFGKLYTHIMVDVLQEEFEKWQEYVKTLKC